jgi:hypothetical protein
MARCAALPLLLFPAILAVAQTTSHRFENQYVAMQVLPGWTVASSPPEVKLTHAKFVLTINPIFEHASGVEGGRFEEVTNGVTSIEAVREVVVQPSWILCAKAEVVAATATLSLTNLYTDDTPENVKNGCRFPADGKPAWFGSYFSGAGSESEYTITLGYDTRDVNQLPKKNDPQLQKVLSDVVAMLKTLRMKPPIVVSSIEPKLVSPGATVTLYGSGFSVPGAGFRPSFVSLPDLLMAPPLIAPDGKSMTFTVPVSMTIMSCDQAGFVDIDGNCVPAPAGDTVVSCPRVNDRHPTICSVPIRPARYELRVAGGMVKSNPLPLDVVRSGSTAVSISLIHPYAVMPGETIRVEGNGFTTTGNTVRIGKSLVNDVASPDGKTLTFEAPVPEGVSSIPGLNCLKASVENANGASNGILISYPVAENKKGITLQFRPGGWAYHPQPQNAQAPTTPPPSQPASQP